MIKLNFVGAKRESFTTSLGLVIRDEKGVMLVRVVSGYLVAGHVLNINIGPYKFFCHLIKKLKIYNLVTCWGLTNDFGP